MTGFSGRARAAAFVTAVAATVPALAGTGSAFASAPLPASPAAGSATAKLVGTIAYRGAEHPYLVGNVADAAKRFGPASPQLKAATAGLTRNVTAIAGLLSGGSPARATTVRGELLARDHAELAYAAAVLAAHRAGAKGTTHAEKVANARLAKSSQALVRTAHALVPSLKVARLRQLFAFLDAGDKRALADAALGEPAQYAAVEAGSVALGSALADVGVQAVGTPLARSRAVSYRADLEIAFTEHVYQTGLLGQAILLTGPGSPAAVAARQADDENTAFVSEALREIGGTPNTQKIWAGHITGYREYLAHLATGQGSVAAAQKLFAAYEHGIAADLHHAVPALGTPMLKTMFTMHVAGTLTVFRLEKAGSPALYPTAQAGAADFAAFAVTIAKAQTRFTG